MGLHERRRAGFVTMPKDQDNTAGENEPPEKTHLSRFLVLAKPSVNVSAMRNSTVVPY